MTDLAARLREIAKDEVVPGDMRKFVRQAAERLRALELMLSGAEAQVKEQAAEIQSLRQREAELRKALEKIRHRREPL